MYDHKTEKNEGRLYQESQTDKRTDDGRQKQYIRCCSSNRNTLVNIKIKKLNKWLVKMTAAFLIVRLIVDDSNSL